ncbi:MAG: single-stranded DNA-binding protein [Alphaproteobacteria bacterium]
MTNAKKLYNNNATATLVGNIGSTPKELKTKGDKVFYALNIATRDTVIENGKKIEGDVNWFSVSFFQPKAIAAVKALKKGQFVRIEANLASAKKGDKHETYLHGYSVEILSSKREGKAEEATSAQE